MNSLQPQAAERTAWIVQQARSVGFNACGVVKADHFPELDRLQEWLERGYAGEMRYLSDPRRADVRAAMPQVRSVIVCALNYNTGFPCSIERGSADESQNAEPRGWISRYAWGDDYHEVLWKMLNELEASLRGTFGEDFHARSYGDTGPISERILGKHAGLGWIGKNTLLLNQKLGSWFFLGAILTSLELEPTPGPRGTPPRDLCGSCRKCIDACPTEAFVEPYVMDARRCISYLTIELRGSIPVEHREAMGTHVFGCDICQDVCPWNRKAPVTNRQEFLPRGLGGEKALLEPKLEWLVALGEENYRETFRGSPMKRTKWQGLVRNACIALGNALAGVGDGAPAQLKDLLKKHAHGADAVVAESAQWALSRIKQVAGRS